MALTRLSPGEEHCCLCICLCLYLCLCLPTRTHLRVRLRPAIAIIYFNYFFASVVSGCSYNLTASQIAHEMLLEYFVAMLAIMGLTTTFDKRSQRQLQPFGKYP